MSTMDSVIQYLLNRSKLDVTLVRIGKATDEYGEHRSAFVRSNS
jgi:hypothetical protein